MNRPSPGSLRKNRPRSAPRTGLSRTGRTGTRSSRRMSGRVNPVKRGGTAGAPSARPRSRTMTVRGERTHRWPIPSTPTPRAYRPARTCPRSSAPSSTTGRPTRRSRRPSTSARPARTAATSTSSTTGRRSPTGCRTTATSSPGTSRTWCRATRPCAASRSSAASAGTPTGCRPRWRRRSSSASPARRRSSSWASTSSTRPAVRPCSPTPRTGSATSPARPGGWTSRTTTRPSTPATWSRSCGRSGPCTTRDWCTRASGCWRTASGARRRCRTPRPGWTTSTGTVPTRR